MSDLVRGTVERLVGPSFLLFLAVFGAESVENGQNRQK